MHVFVHFQSAHTQDIANTSKVPYPAHSVAIKNTAVENESAVLILDENNCADVARVVPHDAVFKLPASGHGYRAEGILVQDKAGQQEGVLVCDSVCQWSGKRDW